MSKYIDAEKLRVENLVLNVNLISSMKYIDAGRLRAELEKRLKNVRDYMNGAGMKYKGPKYYKAQGKESAYDALLNVIDSLQQEQPEKYIELNGIKYRKVPAKTNDKICKDCDYFLDNGMCKLVDCCPCVDDDTILERLQEKPKVDLEEAATAIILKKHPIMKDAFTMEMAFYEMLELVKAGYELGLKAKEE